MVWRAVASKAQEDDIILGGSAERLVKRSGNGSKAGLPIGQEGCR